MGRLVRTLTRLSFAVVAISVCVAGVGCFEPGMVPDAWVPAKWVDPWAALDHGKLTVWVVVPHGNPFGLQKARIVPRTQGSFGVSTSELPAAMRRSLHPNAEDASEIPLQHDPQFDVLEQRLRREFPDLDVDFEDVSADDVVSEVGSTPAEERPDAVLVSLPPNAARGPDTSIGIVVNCPEYEVPQVDGGQTAARFAPQVFLLREQGHDFSRQQAFALWLTEGSGSRFEEQTQEGDAAAKVAERAYRNLLAGKNIGVDADPELLPAWSTLPSAVPNKPVVQRSRNGRLISMDSPIPHQPDDWQVDVIAAQAGWESAEVMLRGTNLASGQLNVRHAMMILRMDDAGRWRVLHVAMDLSVPQQRTAMKVLARAGEVEERLLVNEGTIPQGISQAAPTDGDQRPPQPYLWWDNLGGATLQVVEWQPGASASNLFFIPDSASRLKTEVTARFASNAGMYRWRVWSVGPDGTVLVGTWRTLRIAFP